MRVCPQCSASLSTPLACEACQSLFEPVPDITPFELFGLEPGFALDVRALEQRLRKTMRLVHPDHFSSAPDALRDLAERNSARNNAAFVTLADPAARADWLVGWLGGPDEERERAMPQDFLLEVLEWNERLEEARGGIAEALQSLPRMKSMLEERRADALARIARILTPLPARGAESLREARQQLNVVRYLDRALEEIRALYLRGPAPRV